MDTYNMLEKRKSHVYNDTAPQFRVTIDQDTNGLTEDVEYMSSKTTQQHKTSNTRKCLLKFLVFVLTVIMIDAINYAYHKLHTDTNANQKGSISKSFNIDSIVHRTYKDWDEIRRSWAPCLPVDTTNEAQHTNLLFLQKVAIFGATNTLYSFDPELLLQSQYSVLNRDTHSGSNFTTPLLYSLTEPGSYNYFPCLCSISIEDRSEHWTKGRSVINMFNMLPIQKQELGGSKFTAVTKISIPFIKENEEPFWIRLPPELNVTFESYTKTATQPLQRDSLIFTDVVNMINIILCHRISNGIGLSDIKIEKRVK